MKNRWVTILVFSLIGLSGVIFLIVNWDKSEWPPVKPTAISFVPTFTFTPLPDTGKEGVTIVDTDCFDWEYKKLTIIYPLEPVKVLGRNVLGDWLRVRWPKFSTDCWVKTENINPINYNLVDLLVVYDPFPPPITPTLTSTPTNIFITLTPNLTIFPVKTPGDFNNTPQQIITTIAPVILTTAVPSNITTVAPVIITTAVPPIITTVAPAIVTTAVPPIITTAAPVIVTTAVPPTPTNLPSGPRECNDGIDNDGDGKTDHPADDGCRNKGDDSE